MSRQCIVAPLYAKELPATGEVIRLGPWCDVIDDSAYAFAGTVDPYGGATRPSAEELDAVYDDVIAAMSRAMDAYHRTDLGVPYWSVLAGQFMSALVPVVSDLQQRIDSVRREETTSRFLGVQPLRVPTTNRSGLSALYFDRATIGQLASGIAVALSPSTVTTRHEAAAMPSPHRRRSAASNLRPRRFVRWAANRFAGARHGTRRHGAWMHGHVAAPAWRRMSRLRVPVLPFPPPPSAMPSGWYAPWGRETRDELSNAFASVASDAPSSLAQLTLAVAHLVLPWRFAEGWSFRDDYRALVPVSRRRFVVTLFPAEQRLALLATSRSLGAKIAICQHGGYYGEGTMGWAERYERRVSDGFVSWGWQDDGVKPVIPAPSLRLAAFATKYLRLSEEAGEPSEARSVVFFTNFSSDPPFGFGIGAPTPNRRFSTVDEVLAPIVQSGCPVVVRRHPKARAHDIVDPELASAVRLEDPHVSAAESIVRSSLVVLDVFGSTTFLECLAVGHPVVLFLASTPEGRDEEQNEAIRDLCKAGVISVGRAAMEAFWRGPATAVATWWSSPEVSAAVERYRMRHAVWDADGVGPYTEAIQDWMDRVDPDSERILR